MAPQPMARAAWLWPRLSTVRRRANGSSAAHSPYKGKLGELIDKAGDAPSFTEPLPRLLRLPSPCPVWHHGYAWSLHHPQSPLRTESGDARSCWDSSRHTEPLTSPSAD